MKNIQTITKAAIETLVHFFDLEAKSYDQTLTYPVPVLREKCPECGDFEWKFLESDWEDGKSVDKWVSYRCQGRKFTITEERRHGPPLGYYLPCEFVARMPIDESTRIIRAEENVS